MPAKRKVPHLYIIMASRGESAWLVSRAYSGTAVFRRVQDAYVFSESVQATGTELSILRITAKAIVTL